MQHIKSKEFGKSSEYEAIRKIAERQIKAAKIEKGALEITGSKG